MERGKANETIGVPDGAELPRYHWQAQDGLVPGEGPHYVFVIIPGIAVVIGVAPSGGEALWPVPAGVAIADVEPAVHRLDSSISTETLIGNHQRRTSTAKTKQIYRHSYIVSGHILYQPGTLPDSMPATYPFTSKAQQTVDKQSMRYAVDGERRESREEETVGSYPTELVGKIAEDNACHLL